MKRNYCNIFENKMWFFYFIIVDFGDVVIDNIKESKVKFGDIGV